jgi:hypothetical protein
VFAKEWFIQFIHMQAKELFNAIHAHLAWTNTKYIGIFNLLYGRVVNSISAQETVDIFVQELVLVPESSSRKGRMLFLAELDSTLLLEDDYTPLHGRIIQFEPMVSGFAVKLFSRKNCMVTFICVFLLLPYVQYTDLVSVLRQHHGKFGVDVHLSQPPGFFRPRVFVLSCRVS